MHASKIQVAGRTCKLALSRDRVGVGDRNQTPRRWRETANLNIIFIFYSREFEACLENSDVRPVSGGICFATHIHYSSIKMFEVFYNSIYGFVFYIIYIKEINILNFHYFFLFFF